MTDEETIVLIFLQTSPESYFGRKEIARRAVRRKVYEENPRWADEPLASLLLKKLIEENQQGLVRMRKDELLP